MKPLFTTLRGLAAAVLLSVILITSVPAGAKLHGRGFVEAGLGITTVAGSDVEPDNAGGVALGYMLSATYGVQLKKNYVGAGIGLMPRYLAVGTGTWETPWGDGICRYRVDAGRLSGISVPVFLNYRYDFFSTRKRSNPYIGVKAGIFIPGIGECSFDSYEEYSDGEEYRGEYNRRYEYLEADSYLAIEFGIRQRISSSSGFSFGITIQNVNNTKIDEWAYEYFSYGCAILAKIGFDF